MARLGANLKRRTREGLKALLVPRCVQGVPDDDGDEEARRTREYFGTCDFPPEWVEVVERTRPHTLTSPERVGGLIAGIEHVVKNDVPGVFVECGIWRGGSSMAAALTFRRLGELRDLYLFDTYEGMPEPTQRDVDLHGVAASEWWDARQQKEGAIKLGATVEAVTRVMHSTGYPSDHVHLIRGTVEHSIPDQAPKEIALLRLDTDFYESTRHELLHLWPRLSPGGVLIVDDYGHFAGAREAVDEYLGDKVFLHRLDYSGRLVVK